MNGGISAEHLVAHVEQTIGFGKTAAHSLTLLRHLPRIVALGFPVLVGVLKGAVVFTADLLRAVDLPTSLDFMSVSSYGASARSSGVVRLAADLSVSIEGRDVIIVEDIIDTGRTISYLRRNLATRHPRSLALCVLLDKVARREVEVALDYVGFAIPDDFVVGYGLDHDGRYRHLADIAVLDLASIDECPAPFA